MSFLFSLISEFLKYNNRGEDTDGVIVKDETVERHIDFLKLQRNKKAKCNNFCSRISSEHVTLWLM